MTYIEKITHYFRQSIIDADRLCPDDKDLLVKLGAEKIQKADDVYIAVPNCAWEKGRIETSLANQIIMAKQIKERPPLQEIEIVFFPRVDLLTSQGAYKQLNKRQVLLPLVIFVRLQHDGELKPSQKSPWIPRAWLSPNQSTDEPIGEVMLVDDFFTQNPFEGINTWQQLTDYCWQLLSAATGNNNEVSQHNSTKIEHDLFTLSLHKQYSLSQQSLLQLEPPVSRATTKILKVLDYLIEDTDRAESSTLYKKFCGQDLPDLAKNIDLQFDEEASKKHVGQMSGEFPLSPKQRNALHHLSALDQGNILTVNGPPGTGKTTLIRSVVANLWTKAALNEEEPPLIVATSTINQAVTNILESFAKTDETSLPINLQGRWLPSVGGYGLFACSSDRASEKNPYQYLGPKDEGCMQDWHTQQYIDRAGAHFLSLASAWCGSTISDFVSAKKQLHSAMKELNGHIQDGQGLAAAFSKIERKIVTKFTSCDALRLVAEECATEYSDMKSTYELWRSRLDLLYQTWGQRSFLVQLFIWLPPIRKHALQKNAQLLNQWSLNNIDNDDSSIEFYLQTKAQECQRDAEAHRLQLAELQNLIASHDCARAGIEKWISAHLPQTIFAVDLVSKVNEINDRVNRFTLFKLATHYWESRWLIEFSQFLADGDEDKKSPIKTLRKLRRYAKLTPCFVSTFYMLPSTFICYEKFEGAWKDIPLLNEIDLLIIDEAGQALPEIAAAGFALAKRALVVGDTDQIEPVWRIPASIDRSNLVLFKLLDSEQFYANHWLTCGLIASSGNVMRVAQRQCHFHQFPQLQRGLYLTEHRRCYDGIIGYCNELVYRGLLEPKRGAPPHQVPWGMMSMIETYSASQSFGGSRGNAGEATAIAQWLKSRLSQIIAYAHQTNPDWKSKSSEEVLKLSVGIVTPFKKQASLIQTQLKAVGINDLTVGTVHSLQGDERILILFSSVYGESDLTLGKFYDKGTNMLNVAVSRAKDSFIVFGHPSVFGATNKGTPSGLLRAKLGLLANNKL